MTPLDTLALLAFAFASVWPIAYILAWLVMLPIIAWQKAKSKVEERKRTHIFRKTKKRTYF